MTYAVEFNDVSRLYGDVRAVDGVTIAIRDGEFFSMLGPSGSGKTTCLRLGLGLRGRRAVKSALRGKNGGSGHHHDGGNGSEFFHINSPFNLVSQSIKQGNP